MIIVNSEFRSNVIDLLEIYGFAFDRNSDSKFSKFRRLEHKHIPDLAVKYREYHGRIKIEISGNTITSPRNVEYDETHPNAINNLKYRLNRILKKETEVFGGKNKRIEKNLNKKKIMDHKIRHFNHYKGGHSIVVDPESLEDEYASFVVYYRSYEFTINVDDDGVLFTNQSILNKPYKNLNMSQICKIIDVLVNDFN